LIHADGVLEEQELEFLDVLKGQMVSGIEPVTYKIEDLTKVFDTRVSRYTVMLELIGLGYADQDFDPGEQALVLDVAEVFGMTNDVIEEIEYWVTRQMSLVAEANDMMGG
jgi:hypothetical protein